MWPGNTFTFAMMWIPCFFCPYIKPQTSLAWKRGTNAKWIKLQSNRTKHLTNRTKFPAKEQPNTHICRWHHFQINALHSTQQFQGLPQDDQVEYHWTYSAWSTMKNLYNCPHGSLVGSFLELNFLAWEKGTSADESSFKWNNQQTNRNSDDSFSKLTHITQRSNSEG